MCVPSIQARRTVSGQYMSECGKQEAWGKRCWGKQEFEKGPSWPWALTAPRVLLGLPRGLSPALLHGVCLFPPLSVPVLPSLSSSLCISVSLCTLFGLSVPTLVCVLPPFSLSPLFSVSGFFVVLFYFLVSIALCFSLFLSDSVFLSSSTIFSPFWWPLWLH